MHIHDSNSNGRHWRPTLTLLLVLAVSLWASVFSCHYIAIDAEHPGVTVGRRPEAPVPELSNASQGLTFENAGITKDTNIHYTGGYCNECHAQTPSPGNDPHLKYDGDYQQLCRCHGVSPAVYIHPFDMMPSAAKKQRIPVDFPLEDGKVTCLTCHDIYLQCQKRLFNKTSLRGAPYPRRTDFCYRCHGKEICDQAAAG